MVIRVRALLLSTHLVCACVSLYGFDYVIFVCCWVVKCLLLLFFLLYFFFTIYCIIIVRSYVSFDLHTKNYISFMSAKCSQFQNHIHTRNTYSILLHTICINCNTKHFFESITRNKAKQNCAKIGIIWSKVIFTHIRN